MTAPNAAWRNALTRFCCFAHATVLYVYPYLIL